MCLCSSPCMHAGYLLWQIYYRSPGCDTNSWAYLLLAKMWPSCLCCAGVTLGRAIFAESAHNCAKAEPAHLQWVGWVSVLGFGVIFALLAVFLVWVDVKFSGVIYNSEQVCPEGDAARVLACVPCHAAVQFLLVVWSCCRTGRQPVVRSNSRAACMQMHSLWV